ncbi:MAG: alpha-L-fucosidase [FCB group bacterium]|jgi:alpha-L-fucosidase|nr:alpha-L-fucosidase [FCB group bacterium]
MDSNAPTRRGFLKQSGALAATTAMASMDANAADAPPPEEKRGAQRLSLERLKAFEALGYGMFIHFGMSTFVQNELPDGQAPATTYAPDKLDVDQWVSVARDAGMKYIVLTSKHVAGHCLWPSKHTDYTVANSTDKTDVMGKFVEACRSKGILPGFYYCSWDNHNRFGSVTPSDKDKGPVFTTSLYQTFQTRQVTELMTTYGPFAEVWIDIPSVLGRGYRTFLYNHIAMLDPNAVIMMNSGISTQEKYDVEYAWPSDIIAIERSLPPASKHTTWREIEGKEYYMPGEVCDPIGKEWFYVNGDAVRSDESLLQQYQACRERGVNLLLDVPPDQHGVIPDESVQALMRLQKSVG